MPALDLPTAFVNNVDLAESAGALNQLIDAAVLLDGWSYRRMALTDAAAAVDTAAYNRHQDADIRLWWGAVQKLAGNTTLTIAGYAASTTPGSTIKVYLNGSGTAAATITPSSSWSGTVSLASFSVGDIILVDVRTSGNTSETSEYIVRDVYTSPLTVTTAWPTPPTFAGVYDSTRLNALITMCQHLFERINAVPILPTMAHFWAYGTSKVETRVQYAGSVARVYSDDILRIIGAVDIFNDSEYMEVLLNGSVVWDNIASPWSMIAYGQPFPTTISIPLALSGVSVGARADVVIRSTVTNDGRVAGAPILNSRYSFHILRSEPDSSGYPVATPPAELSQGNISATNLNTRLNALSTMLTAIKTRLDANSFMWDRARGFRRRFAQDDVQNAKLMQRHTPLFQRQGDRLIVRGKNVELGWSSRIIDPQEDAWRDYKYHYDKKATVISGDQVDTQTFFLDSCEDLFPSQLYAVTGDAYYVAEYLN